MVYLNGEKMMNGCNTTATAAQEPPAVCLNWSASSPSINMSFATLSAPNTQKQLWEFETHTGVNNHHNSSTNFILPASNGFLDFSTSLIPSPFGTQNSFSQIPSDQFHQNGFLKREEEYCYGSTTLDPGSCYSSASRIGLNLGHRTYFSSRDTAVIDRLFKRSRVFYQGSQVPRCQAEGCKADLTNAKHYHRRHKVCEFHSKATKVIAGGLEQRFCQQCSRFHVLAEFDEVKRSCRKRLADHNRRRRKPQHPAKTAEKDVKGCNDKSLSSTLPLLTAKGSEGGCRREQSETQQQEQQVKTGVEEEQSRKGVVAGGGLSLGGFVQNGRRSSFPSPSLSFSGRERSDQTNVSLTPAGCPLLSSCFHDQAQHQAEDLQNLFHLGKTMFEVEML